MDRSSMDRLTLGDDTPSLLPVRPRLFAVDVDGTLLNSRHQVSEATKKAVAQARASGVEVLLASSRGPRAMYPILRTLELTDPAVFIGSQGAVTGRYASDGTLRIIDRQSIPVLMVKEAVAAAIDARISVNWYAGTNWYVSHVDHTVEREARIVEDTPQVRDLLAEEVGPDKLMMIAPGEDLTVLQSIAAGLPSGVMAQVSNPTYLEITRADVDKASAVRNYCDSRGIAAADVVAFGDGPNDLGLFAFAGTSIAPANARPQVIDRATLLTRSNDDDGVAYAMTALLS